MTLEEIRASDAKKLSDYFNGKTDRHPHGLSGKKWIIPYQLSKETRDWGEWARAIGVE